MRTAPRRRRTAAFRGGVAVLVAAALASSLTGAAAAEPSQPSAQPSAPLPGQSTAAAGSTKPVVAKQPNAYHLSEKLAGFLDARDDGLSAAAAAASVSLGPSGPGSLLRTADGRLIVTVRFADYSGARIAAVRDQGAEVLNRNPASSRITVAVAQDDLEAVGEVEGVEYVDEELTPATSATCDTVVSEGDGLLEATATRTDLGLTGSGVKVGVLSDTFNQASGAATTAAQDVAQDNLPGTTNDCGHPTPVGVGAPAANGGTDEGRAMAQIVHDLAPGRRSTTRRRSTARTRSQPTSSSWPIRGPT